MNRRPCPAHSYPVACILACAALGASPAIAAIGDTDTPSATVVKAAVIPIQSDLTDITVDSVARRIEEARSDGVKVIVFDIDTPGGMVTSSIAIADLIRELFDIKTVAWVNPTAHSGGAIVAVACDEIVMARSSRIGDSQVIMGGPGGVGAVPEELQAKAYTPVLADFRASARLNGYDQVLCEAFVLPDREVWWVENIDTQERKFVRRDEKMKLLGESEEPSPSEEEEEKEEKEDKKDKDKKKADDTPPAKPKGDTPAAKDAQWKLVETYYDAVLDMEVDTIQPIVPDNQLLEMSASEAQAYGFSKGVVTNEQELRQKYGLGTLIRLDPSWSEGLAHWMTSIYVRGFLMLIILLGAYVEFHTPGVGVPGLVALSCLAIFVGAPYLTGLANVWEVVFIVLGAAMLLLEVFVIPGFGVAGISGVFLLIIGLLATFVPDEPGRTIPLYLPQLRSTIEGLKVAMITLVSSMAASLIGMVLLSRFLPRTPLFRRIVPANPTPSEVLTGDPYRGAARVGDPGIAEGPLRPSGKARFGNMLVDVVTQGDYLENGTELEVVERRGNRVVVRAVS